MPPTQNNRALPLSRHAKIRCQQRGIRRHVALCVLENYDIVEPAKGGCTLLRISRMEAQRLASVRHGLNARQLSGLGAIVCDMTGNVVTLMHLNSRRTRRA